MQRFFILSLKNHLCTTVPFRKKLAVKWGRWPVNRHVQYYSGSAMQLFAEKRTQDDALTYDFQASLERPKGCNTEKTSDLSGSQSLDHLQTLTRSDSVDSDKILRLYLTFSLGNPMDMMN